MRVEVWLEAAIADAERRGLPELAPLLKVLARATEALRGADISDPLIDDQTGYAGHPRRTDC